MKTLKRILYFIVTLVEIGLLAGAYVIDDLALKRLGLTRWLNFNSAKWEETLPLDGIKIAVILVLTILAIACILVYLKKRKSLRKFMAVMVVMACVMSLGAIGYILLNSFETARGYYVICPLVSTAAALQIGKTLAGILTGHGQER